MAYFNEEMTSSEASKLFFELVEKTKADKIPLTEFQSIVSEYNTISEKIVNREMDEMKVEYEGGIVWSTEEEDVEGN